MGIKSIGTADWLGVATVCVLAWIAGCDMGLEQSANRYEQLNIETTKLIGALEKIQDEKSAKANEAELVAAADRVRDVQRRIKDAEEKRAKSGGGGMGRITNYRQASLFQQSGDAARRQVERIRATDMKAGDIVDKAMEGIDLPPPPTPVPTGY